MRVSVVTEHRFVRTSAGIHTTGALSYSSWGRYLDVFDSVRVIARVKEVQGKLPSDSLAGGLGVSFCALPYYVGPAQLSRRLFRIRECLMSELAEAEAVIVRLPSAIALLADPYLRQRPFAVEAIGDPWDALGAGAYHHPLRPLFRSALSRGMRRQCRAARATLYVTEQALQTRYPPGPGTYTAGCSDVQLSPQAFVARPRRISQAPSRPTLITVGSLEHLYKAPDALLDAVAACARDGVDLRAVFIGDGRYRLPLQQRCCALGIRDRVEFRGNLEFGEKIRSELDRADLFVLPSRQEGLPRALLEAMARALPAIGSAVGGIPELLHNGDLVPPADAVALARKIREVVDRPERLRAMSERNLSTARQYEEDRIAPTRRLFLAHVKAETEAFLKDRNTARDSSHDAPVSMGAG